MQEPLKKRNCEYCGRTYMPRVRHQKYCPGVKGKSSVCGFKAWAEQHPRTSIQNIKKGE